MPSPTHPHPPRFPAGGADGSGDPFSLTCHQGDSTITSLNDADVQWRLGDYTDRTLPATLGREAAGSIEALGPGIATLKESHSWRYLIRISELPCM
jgi:hypothetical protein